jgi:hypothetical protein
LRGGTMLVHSPCEPSDALVGQIALLGDVSDVVAPNWFHDLYLAQYKKLYPQAAFWAPARLASQQPSVINRVLDDATHPPWFEDLPYHLVRGVITFDECIFLHPSTRTLIVADLLTNAGITARTPPLTKLGYRFLGLDGSLKIFPVTQWFSFTCSQALRDAAQQIFSWSPKHIIVGHGTPMAEQVDEKLLSAFQRNKPA